MLFKHNEQNSDLCEKRAGVFPALMSDLLWCCYSPWVEKSKNLQLGVWLSCETTTTLDTVGSCQHCVLKWHLTHGIMRLQNSDSDSFGWCCSYINSHGEVYRDVDSLLQTRNILPPHADRDQSVLVQHVWGLWDDTQRRQSITLTLQPGEILCRAFSDSATLSCLQKN